MKLRIVVFVGLSLVAAGVAPALASNEAAGVSTIAPTLKVNATVAKAIRLTLATNTQCAISNPGSPTDYSMDFGTVDALGISAATCGAKFSPAAAVAGTAGNPAVYYSDYKLRPVFSSQNSTTGNITAYVSANFSTTASGLLTIVQANASPSVVTDLTAMGITSGTATSVVASAANATDYTRYLGVSVAPQNGAGTLTGADSATITYTLTVP